MTRASRKNPRVGQGDLDSPQTGRGALAYAENATTNSTTVSAAAVGIGYCVVDVEPTECDAWIGWECRFAVVTAPGGTYAGSLDGIVWEVTLSGSTPIVTEVDRCPVPVAAGQAVKTEYGKAKGDYHVGPTTTRRRFALGAGRQLDNVLCTLIGSVRNQPAARSYIAAVAK